MKNRIFYIYTLSDPYSSVVRYVGCTTNPRTRYSGHISSSRFASYADHDNKKDTWIYQLLKNGARPVLKIVFETSDLEEASEMEGRFYDLYKDSSLLGKDPNIFRYNNQCGDESVKSKAFGCYLKELLNDFIISKKDLFEAIYSNSNMSYKTSGARIDIKLSQTFGFSDSDIYRIYSYFESKGLKTPIDLPFKVKTRLASTGAKLSPDQNGQDPQAG